MILNIFDTKLLSALYTDETKKQALTYMVKHLDLVLSPEQVRSLGQIRMFNSTPICELFQQIVQANKLNSMVFYNLNSASDIPTALTLDDVTIDGKLLSLNYPVPEKLQKCWVNLSAITSNKDLYNGVVNVSDTTALSSFVVRSMLVSTYHDSDMWLNPRLATMVIDNYSLTVSHVLGQAFNLDINERTLVRTYFAAYYAQLLGSSSSDLARPPLLYRCSFLGSVNDIEARMDAIMQYRPNSGNSLLTPELICNVLKHVGPSRLSTLTPNQLFRVMSTSSLDSQIMLIALEYPPYWVYQMLRVSSGFKNPTISNVVKLTNSKKSIVEFALELLKSATLIRTSR